MKHWKRVSANQIGDWITSTDPRYRLESVALHKLGTAWDPARYHPYQCRVILVYSVAPSNGDWLVLGVATSADDANDTSALRCRFPDPPPQCIMPEAPLGVQFVRDQDGTLDQVSDAMQRLCRGQQLNSGDWCNLDMQCLLQHVIDVHRPGIGDSIEAVRVAQETRFVTWLLTGAGERAIIQFIYQRWPGTESGLVACDDDDDLRPYFDYATRHGLQVPAPTCFLRSPLVDTHITSGQLAHLDLPGWILQRLATERVQTFRLNQRVGKMQEPPEQLAYIYAELPRLYAQEEAERKRREAESEQASKEQRKSKHFGGGQPVLHTADIEDLAGKLAPCMRALVRGSAFPKDKTRNAFVRSCLAGGVAPDSIEEAILVLDQRERGADTTRVQTLARFDYRHEFVKGYAPDFDCGAEHLQFICPFAGDTGARCKQCHGQLYKEHPNLKPAEGDLQTLGDHMHNWGPYKYPRLIGEARAL